MVVYADPNGRRCAGARCLLERICSGERVWAVDARPALSGAHSVEDYHPESAPIFNTLDQPDHPFNWSGREHLAAGGSACRKNEFMMVKAGIEWSFKRIRYYIDRPLIICWQT